MAEGPRQFDADPLREMGRSLGPRRVREIVDLFLEHSPERLRQAREALAASDLGAAAAAVHSIKSSAGIVGAGRLMEIARTMERLARNEEGPAVSALLPSLERAFEEAEVLLREYRNGLDA